MALQIWSVSREKGWKRNSIARLIYLIVFLVIAFLTFLDWRQPEGFSNSEAWHSCQCTEYKFDVTVEKCWPQCRVKCSIGRWCLWPILVDFFVSPPPENGYGILLVDSLLAMLQTSSCIFLFVFVLSLSSFCVVFAETVQNDKILAFPFREKKKKKKKQTATCICVKPSQTLPKIEHVITAWLFFWNWMVNGYGLNNVYICATNRHYTWRNDKKIRGVLHFWQLPTLGC